VARRERDDLFATGYEGWIAADNKRTSVRRQAFVTK
jgi:hypothetical protein